MIAYWVLVSLAILLAVLSLRGDRAKALHTMKWLEREPWTGALPAATVIVPIKGPDHNLSENLAALAALDYPDYELIVVAKSDDDVEAGVVPAAARLVIAGEGDARTGEKINNLLAAVAAARPESRVFAFADSDGKVGVEWLQSLVIALEEPNAGAATGYRWHLPQPPDFWSLVRCVWNSAIAGSLGPGDNAFAWGGAMAIRRETFEKARVTEYWKGAISDDFRLAEAVHAVGMQVVYTPGALVVSSDRTSAGEFFGWIKRQLIITRVYHPKLWRLGMFAHIVYCAAMAASIYMSWEGSTFTGEYMLVTQLGLGMLKGMNRSAIAKSALPPYKQWFDSYSWVLIWWVPFVTWIWLWAFLASATTRTVKWRGYRYEL